MKIRDKIRQLILRPPSAPKQYMLDRRFIVTGASRGSLGHATARILLNWGAIVTITRRSGSEALRTGFAAELPAGQGDRLFAYNLDLASTESTRAFAAAYQSEQGKLDVLINNAGIHLDLMSKWKAPQLSNDGIEMQWRTNYLGTVQLSHLLLPLLLESGGAGRDARLVNVVSMLHDKGSNSEFFDPALPYNSWRAYGQSKLGLVHFTSELQRRYAGVGLNSFCLHPGSVYTNVAGKGLAGNPLIEGLRSSLAPIERFFLMTPEEGAQTQLLCATAPGLEGGRYYRNCRCAEPSPEARDSGMAEKLWQQTESWLARSLHNQAADS